MDAASSGPAATDAAAQVVTSTAAANATGTGRFGDDISTPAILLESPREENAVITTRDIEVRGRVREGAGPVVLILESSTAERLLVVSAYPVRLPESGDGRHMSEFIGSLPVPEPRPTGPAIVRVLALDTSGTATDVLDRAIQIGAMLDPTYGDGAARPPTGEDGLMGGITSGTNFAWRTDGGSPAANDP